MLPTINQMCNASGSQQQDLVLLNWLKIRTQQTMLMFQGEKIRQMCRSGMSLSQRVEI